MKKLGLAVVAAVLTTPAFATEIEAPASCLPGIVTFQYSSDSEPVMRVENANQVIACAVALVEAQLEKQIQNVVDMNYQISTLAQYNADIKAEVDTLEAELAQLQEDYDWAYNVALQQQNYGQDVGDVIAKYNKNDAKRWFKGSDRAAFIDDLYTFIVGKLDELEDRKSDLKRSEDRIRQLEEQIQWHKEGGYWNPTHW